MSVEQNDDHLLAALALSDLMNARDKSEPEQYGYRQQHVDHQAPKPALKTEVPVPVPQAVSQTPEEWPFIPGKGWFAKTRRGNEIRFLERMFLMLSFGHLRLRKTPSRELRETIRWLDPDAARAAGVPEGLAAFEIVTVELFEDEVYPQYASGSFNKTAAKWCLLSPAANTGGGGTGRKLNRQCMYLPAQWTVDGVTYDLDVERVFRPLPAGTHAAEVYAYAENAVRSLQEQRVRHVYRLREEADRRRKHGQTRALGGAHAQVAAANGAPALPAVPAMEAHFPAHAMPAVHTAPTAAAAELAGEPQEEDEEIKRLTGARPASAYHATLRGTPSPVAGLSSAGPRIAPGPAGAPARGYGTATHPRTVTPPSQLPSNGIAFQTPDNTSPRAECTLVPGNGMNADRIHPPPPLPSVHTPSLGALGPRMGRPGPSPVHGSRPGPLAAHPGISDPSLPLRPLYGQADPAAPPMMDTDWMSRRHKMVPSVAAHMWAAHAANTGHFDPQSLHGQHAVGDRGAQSLSSGAATPTQAGAGVEGPPTFTAVIPSSGGGLQFPRVVRFPQPNAGSSAPPASRLAPGPAAGGQQQSLSSRSVASARAGAPAVADDGSAGQTPPVPTPRAGQRSGQSSPWPASSGPGLGATDVFPFAPGKGWFAFNRQGKSIFFLERLYRLLTSPQAPLVRHPGHVLGDVIRWMDPATAADHGVPPNVTAFEIASPELFESEVYPQFKSGSFRKTAKHWCLVSPQPKEAAVQKLSIRCMYLPRSRTTAGGAAGGVDVAGCFRAPDPSWGQAEIEQHIAEHIRPLEERVRAALQASAAAGRTRAVEGVRAMPPEKRVRAVDEVHANVPPAALSATIPSRR